MLVDKREEKCSYGTKDLQTAKRRQAEAVAKCEKRWAALRAGARPLTEREAQKLAAGIHDRWLIIYGENPTLQLTWRSEWLLIAFGQSQTPRRAKMACPTSSVLIKS